MKLIRKNNGFPAAFNSNLDHLFGDDLFSLPKAAARWNNLPPVNISETDDQFSVDLAAPGFNKSDFKINLDNNLLTISAERKEEKASKESNFSRREFIQDSFSRAFNLPENKINEKDILANYDNGVLNISLPKKEEAKKQAAKMIEIS